MQDPKYKNRELSIISQLDHPNIVEMKDYFLKVIEGECKLFILMEHMDTSLHELLKNCRRNKRTIAQPQRKIFAFQLLKALAYLEVLITIFSSIMYATATSNRPTFSSTATLLRSRYVISARPRLSRIRRTTFPTFARATIGHLSLS